MEDLKVKATIVAWVDTEQAQQDLANFTDDIKAQQERLRSDRWIVLASNLAELRMKAKQLQEELKKTTDPETKLYIATNIELVKKDITDANRRLNNFIGTWDETQSVLGKNFQEIDKSINKTSGTLSWFANTLVWWAIIVWINSLAKSILNVAASFQTYDAILTNALWSQELARQAFSLLKDISSETPFTLEEITKSYIKLVNRWIIPTKEEITSLWDLASSQGKSFDQLVEALLDAQTWEFERLKEFWVKAKVSWDNVSFTFKWVTTTVKKTDEAIKDYILWLWELQWVQGAMATQSATFNWAISNLQDSFTNLSSTIWSLFLPLLTPLIRYTSEIVWSITKRVEENKTLSTILSILVIWLWAYLAVAPLITTANLAILASFIPMTVAILWIVWSLFILNEAYKSNFLWFKDFADEIIYKSKILREAIKIIFEWITKVINDLWNTVDNVTNNIKSAFSWLSVLKWVLWSIFWSVFDIVRSQVLKTLWPIWSLISLIQKIPWVSTWWWLFSRATDRVNQQQIANLWITSPEAYNPLDQIISTPTSKIPSSSSNWSSNAKKTKEETEALKEQEKQFKKQTQTAKDYIDSFKKTINEWQKSIDDLTSKIKASNDEIKKLQDAQLSEQEKLANKYVELQAKLLNPQEWDDLTKIQQDLALINQYTTEAQRNEAVRQSTLSDTQKIVEEIQRLQAEQVKKEEEVKALEKQKELEQIILDEFNKHREELEKQYTTVIEEESKTRLWILNNEIARTKELIKLQQQAGTSWFSNQSQLAQNTQNNNNTNNNNQISINVNWNQSPEAIVNEIMTQIQNYNMWNNQ